MGVASGVSVNIGEFLRYERRTAPRLLPLWVMSLIAAVGHVPGSDPWAWSAIAAITLGVVLIPIMGSIRPTVFAYVTSLLVIVALAVLMLNLPLGPWYLKAWTDNGPTGMLAMILIGAAAVSAVASVAWAVLVLVEVVRRLIRKIRTGSALPADASTHTADLTSLSVRADSVGSLWLGRGFVALVSLGMAVALPSFFLMAGIYSRPAAGGPADAFVALLWPLLALGWLVAGVGLCWLMWHRARGKVGVAVIGALSVAIAVVLLAGPDFALVPATSPAQGFAPHVLEFCPQLGEEIICTPVWLFDEPRLASFTQKVGLFAGLALLASAAAYVGLWFRTHAGGKAVAPRA